MTGSPKFATSLKNIRHGVSAHVWLVDPHSRRVYTCETGLVEPQSLKISELGVEITGADIFE